MLEKDLLAADTRPRPVAYVDEKVDLMSGEDTSGGKPLLRSFGRRRGRKLSERQARLMDTTLPAVRTPSCGAVPSNLAELFRTSVGEVWLEIGFGGAEHLLWQARNNPGIGLIGAEPFEEGVVKALQGIEDSGLENVCIHPDDVRPLLAELPPCSLSRAFILFPDPWPKKRHAKRRLVKPDLLSELARTLRPGGQLRLGTDIASYAGDMLLAVRKAGQFGWTAAGPSDWRVRPEDWPQTRYEQKARREGRQPYFLIFTRH